MKALRVKEFSERVTDDGEIALNKAYALPVKYIDSIYYDGNDYYFVLKTYDKCVEEYYREILCELPSDAKKMKWIVVDYDLTSESYLEVYEP
jgi:hypothetical protein